MEYLLKDNWKYVEFRDECFMLSIQPFKYDDGRKPRLPRKKSDGYQLIKDVENYFCYVFNQLSTPATNERFKVSIIIKCGKDKLGKADLDNYCKAIFDGITCTKKVWKDDKQIDELIVKRVFETSEISTIDLRIEKIK